MSDGGGWAPGGSRRGGWRCGDTSGHRFTRWCDQAIPICLFLASVTCSASACRLRPFFPLTVLLWSRIKHLLWKCLSQVYENAYLRGQLLLFWLISICFGCTPSKWKHMNLGILVFVIYMIDSKCISKEHSMHINPAYKVSDPFPFEWINI